MEIKHISYQLVLYIALIEGLALFFLNLGWHPFFVGFIPAVAVLSLYRLNLLQIVINKENLEEFPIIVPSIANGIFMMLLFFIQSFIPSVASAVLGFVSVFATFFVLVYAYNKLNIKINIILKGRKMKIQEVSLLFAVYAGLFEAFILPLMMFFYATMPFLNGFISGLVGSTIALFICNTIIKNKPLLLKTN